MSVSGREPARPSCHPPDTHGAGGVWYLALRAIKRAGRGAFCSRCGLVPWPHAGSPHAVMRWVLPVVFADLLHIPTWLSATTNFRSRGDRHPTGTPPAVLSDDMWRARSVAARLHEVPRGQPSLSLTRPRHCRHARPFLSAPPPLTAPPPCPLRLYHQDGHLFCNVAVDGTATLSAPPPSAATRVLSGTGRTRGSAAPRHFPIPAR